MPTKRIPGKVRPRHIFHEDIENIKVGLKNIGRNVWRQEFVRQYPEYDSLRSYTYLSGMLAHRNFDFALFEALCEFVRKNNPGQPLEVKSRAQLQQARLPL